VRPKKKEKTTNKQQATEQNTVVPKNPFHILASVQVDEFTMAPDREGLRVFFSCSTSILKVPISTLYKSL